MAKQNINKITMDNPPKSHMDYKSNNDGIHHKLNESGLLDDGIFALIDNGTTEDIEGIFKDIEFFTSNKILRFFSDDEIEKLLELKDYFEDNVGNLRFAYKDTIEELIN